MDLSFLFDHPQASIRQFRKGEYLFHQGDIADCIYILQEGSVERIAFNESGDEIIFGTKASESGISAIVGLNNLWIPNHIAFSSFLAVSDVICTHLSADIAREVILQRPDIINAILYLQMGNYMRLRSLFKSHRENKIPNHLAELLAENIVPTKDGLYVPKDLTNVEISRQLGIHQVTVAKIMMFLQKESVLERTSRGIRIMDEDKLKRYANNHKMRYK